MPDTDQLHFEDEGEDYSCLLSESPRQTKASFGKSPAISPSSFKHHAINRASTVVSPFENISASASQSPHTSLNEEAVFVDEHLQTDVLEGWFSDFERFFIAQIFPQFFLQTLSTNHSELLSAEESQQFFSSSSYYGDLKAPSTRDIAYKAQCKQLYSALLTKISKRPSLIYELIAALRFNGWYDPLADKFQSALNSWKKLMHNTLKATTPAFPLPSPLGPAIITSVAGPQQLNANVPIHQASQLMYSMSTAAPAAQLPKPTSLLVNLPEPLSFFVPRPVKAQNLIDNLLSISKKERGWIVLYGMGGSGKTTMAASTVRRFYEIHPNRFIDGIFWLHIGKLNEKVNICSTATTTTPSSAAAIDNQQNQLLLKMEFLAELLRPFDTYQQFVTAKFDQINTATIRLKRHFENHPKSLLILDDVWTTDVVENFNFNIPVLVTTRESSVVPKHFHNIVPVSIYAKDAKKGAESGEVLLMNEAMNLLYKCLTMPEDNELVKLEHLRENNFVKEIISNFKGLPFCIPLIANCMEPFYKLANSTDFGLQYKLEMNDEEGDDEVSTTPCFENWKQLHANIITNNRDQLDHLGTHELVRESIKSLDEHLKVRLYDFVIFAEAVPFRVFQTLWSDLGPNADVKIMEILIKLVNKSLVIKIINTNMSIGSGDASGRPRSPRGRTGSVTAPAAAASFTLHSITLTFLKQELKPEEIKERHSRLIERYLEQYCRREVPSSQYCEYDYSCLPDDQYIYHNLAYHLYSAERWSLFAPIFLNLRFATNKILLVGPSDLLNDYIDYRRYFERADSEKLGDYHSFIASNSNILCEPNVDIIQIALCQPNNSAVYKEAAALVDQLARLASAERLKRTNNNSNSNHSRTAHQLTFFDWCNKQNCSNEAPPKFLSFKCLPEVSFATYSPDSRLIATASGATLQVWDSTTGELVCSLHSQHPEATTINHLVFSRSGQFLLTSADDGTAIMWQNNQWTPPKQHTDAESGNNNNFIKTHRSNRSLTLNNFDFIDSSLPSISMEPTSLSETLSSSYEHLNISSGSHHPQKAELDPVLARQRRRRSSGNSGYGPSSLSGQSMFTKYSVFDLKQGKLKADTMLILEGSDKSRSLSGKLASRSRTMLSSEALSHSIRCGDISSDNRYVLTGNNTANLHLWTAADGQQVASPMLLATFDDADKLDGSSSVADESTAGGGREVECCAFSGDSRFILGLVANVVYIFSFIDKTRSKTELQANGSSSIASTAGLKFSTPPGSPNKVRRAGQISVTLSHRLVHKFKVYNAIFHSGGSSYYPFVFTSSDKYIFEWDLDGNHAQASSFLDVDDDDDTLSSQSKRQNVNYQPSTKLTQEKRKYSTTLSSQHSHSSSSSHLSFVAVSRSGNRIAGFEHTRNEIYLWNRGDETANWGFGSRSPSPVSGGCCPSNVLLRCQSNIVSLAFSDDNERLLGCCRSGEITVWNVGKNVSKSSIVDLKDKFAVAFADKEKSESVRVLTIDTKGFLRQFTGLEGDEDHQFSLDLRRDLATFNETVASEAQKWLPVSPLRLNITCCDIAHSGEVIFGTNAGEVFYYQTGGEHNKGRKLIKEVHGHGKGPPEAVNHVHFIPGTSTHFISISDKCISFIAYAPASATTTNLEAAAFKKDNIPLSILLRRMNSEANVELFQDNGNIKLDSCKFVAHLNLLVFWSNVGHLWVFDYANSTFIEHNYLNNTRITSVHLSAPDGRTDARRQAMVVATASKSIYPFIISHDQAGKVRIETKKVLTSKALPRSIQIASDATFMIVGDDAGGLARISTATRPVGEDVWRVMNAHSEWIHAIALSPDQQYILSASESIKLWSAADGRLLQSFMTNGSVSRLVTQFAHPPPQLDRNQNPITASSRFHNDDSGPRVTVITVTDASTLYILRTLN